MKEEQCINVSLKAVQNTQTSVFYILDIIKQTLISTIVFKVRLLH